MILFRYVISIDDDGNISSFSDSKHYDDLDEQTKSLVDHLKFDKPVRLDIIHQRMIVFLFAEQSSFDAFSMGMGVASNIDEIFRGMLETSVEDLRLRGATEIDIPGIKESLVSIGEQDV